MSSSWITRVTRGWRNVLLPPSMKPWDQCLLDHDNHLHVCLLYVPSSRYHPHDDVSFLLFHFKYFLIEVELAYFFLLALFRPATLPHGVATDTTKNYYFESHCIAISDYHATHDFWFRHEKNALFFLSYPKGRIWQNSTSLAELEWMD